MIPLAVADANATHAGQRSYWGLRNFTPRTVSDHLAGKFPGYIGIANELLAVRATWSYSLCTRPEATR